MFICNIWSYSNFGKSTFETLSFGIRLIKLFSQIGERLSQQKHVSCESKYAAVIQQEFREMC